MGVDLGDLAVKNTISLDSLSGKIIAVDAFNVIYQFLASIRQEDGTPLQDFRGNVTAHLSGLFYRNTKLIDNGIKPIYVFDGERARLKGKTMEARAKAKETAKKKWEAALAKGELKEAKKYAQATSRLTGDMIEESKELLGYMGIPWVQAKGEGEAQAAAMVHEGKAYAAASQDYDCMLFGSPILIRNLSITGRRKVPRQDRFVMVEPEEIKLNETLQSLDITREQLIVMGILTGTDFNEGVYRVGPKTALKIVKEHKSLSEVKKYVKEKYDYEFEVDPEDVFKIFMKPEIAKTKEKFKWGNVSASKIEKLLVERHDFSEDRVERTTNQIIKSFEEKGKQKNLGQWF